MIRTLIAGLALLTLAGCGDDSAPNEAIYGVWKHINAEGERLYGTVEFARSGRFAMRDLKYIPGQTSVDYVGSFKFLADRRLALKVTGAHGNTYDVELGYSIGDRGSGERLSISLPGSVLGGTRAYFER